jgi:hypothetical protein
MDVLAVGDDAPVPLLDRSWVQEVRDEPDARRALGTWTGNSRVIDGRVAPGQWQDRVTTAIAQAISR